MPKMTMPDASNNLTTFFSFKTHRTTQKVNINVSICRSPSTFGETVPLIHGQLDPVPNSISAERTPNQNSVKIDAIYKPMLRSFRGFFRSKFERKHTKKIYMHWGIEDYMKHIERFMDGELTHYYETELNRPKSFVKELTADNFNRMVMEDDNVE